MSSEIPELRTQLETVLEKHSLKDLLNSYTNDDLTLLFKANITTLEIKTIAQAKEELTKRGWGVVLAMIPFTLQDEDTIWNICEKFKAVVAEKSEK